MLANAAKSINLILAVFRSKVRSERASGLPNRGACPVAGRWKNRRVGGPGMRALAMVFLFFPVMLVAMAAPGTLGLSSTWSAVSLTLMGVLLSAVISEPLRRFLLEWAT